MCYVHGCDALADADLLAGVAVVLVGDGVQRVLELREGEAAARLVVVVFM